MSALEQSATGRVVVLLLLTLSACSSPEATSSASSAPAAARTAVPTPDLCASLSREAAAEAVGDEVEPCRVMERTAEALTVQFRGKSTGRGGGSLSAVTVAFRLPQDDGELGFRSAGHEAQLSVRRGDVAIHVTHYTADPRRFRRATRKELGRLLP